MDLDRGTNLEGIREKIKVKSNQYGFRPACSDAVYRNLFRVKSNQYGFSHF